MELTWPEEWWIKFCRQLKRGRFFDNYYIIGKYNFLSELLLPEMN
jgi:hypothetical protein